MVFVLLTETSDRTGRKLVRRDEFTFATREAAERQAREFRGPGGVRVEIQEVQKISDIPKEKIIRVGPELPKRGRQLQKKRLELEKIQKDVEVTEGKIDISKLTQAQKARVRQITGVKAEKAFRVEAGKATTPEEFQKSLFLRQRVLTLGEKIEKGIRTITVSPVQLKVLKGEEVTRRARETREAQLRKQGKEVIFKPSEAFFGIVPTGIKETRPPTEAELTKELKAQKGFVTFIAPKETEEEAERRKQISVFRPIVIEKKAKPKKKPTTRLEKFEERVGLLQKREIERQKRLERGQEFFRQVPGLRGDTFIQKTIRTIPVIPAAAADFFVSIGEKGAAFGEAITIKETRPLIFPELRRAGAQTPAETGRFLKSLVTTPEGVATLPFIVFPFLQKAGVGKKAQATQVLKQISKEKPPTIKGEQFFGLRKIDVDITTQKILRTPKVEVTKPSDIVTTRIRALVAKPTIAVARGDGVSIITIGGKQFTTTKRTFKGKDFFIRSETEVATGKTVTKVFKEDKLLRTIKTTEKPVITFTEPIERISTKQILDKPEALSEAIKTIRTSEGISLLQKGRLTVRGTRVLFSQETLGVRTEVPAVKAFTTIELDLITGKTKLIPKSIEIAETRFKFVDFPPKQKPFILERVSEGIIITKPSRALTAQKTT